jgi:DNA replication and repair protein RecF
MRLNHLSLSNFRNFTRLDIEVPGGPILLVGDNAQGKTSLLEAVYYLATTDSFHASSLRQLINFLEASQELAVARIVADFESLGQRHHMEVRLIQDSTRRGNAPQLRKEILYDGQKVRAGDALGQFNAVLFLPHMLTIVDGAPEERRRYLNLALGQVEPAYGQVLSDYNRALSQRNALLKQLFERQGDPDQLDFWDEVLTDLGARLVHARARAVLELDRFARGIHKDLTHGAEVLRMHYQPAFDPVPEEDEAEVSPAVAVVERASIPLEEIRRSFWDRLSQLRSIEIARGVTTIGPHRDEMRIYSNGIDLGLFGSRGQVRTAMLALKLAEVEWMKDKTGQWPVLLLDEVLAELDAQRRQDLLNRLAQSEQALLTTTDLDLFNREFIDRTTLWRVHAGRLIEEIGHAL